MRPWKIPRPQIGSSNSEKMDVGCQGHQRLGSATEVRRQTASARLTEAKEVNHIVLVFHEFMVLYSKWFPHVIFFK